jgi:hypothetical protein
MRSRELLPWRCCATHTVRPGVFLLGLCGHYLLALRRGVLRLGLRLIDVCCVPRGQLVRRGGRAAHGLSPWLLFQQRLCDLCCHLLALRRGLLCPGGLSCMHCMPSW